jgi:hypothetical protein
MSEPDRLRERVGEVLASLEESYGSFPVNQSTVSVPAKRYTTVRERAPEGCVDAYAEVRNADSEILHVSENGEWVLPGTSLPIDCALGRRVREAVAREAGIEWTIDGLARATITGIRADDADRETIYRMVLVFTGRHTGGRVGNGVEWEDEPTVAAPSVG